MGRTTDKLRAGDPVLLDERCCWMLPLTLKDLGWPQKVVLERTDGMGQFVRLENGRLYHADRFKRA